MVHTLPLCHMTELPNKIWARSVQLFWRLLDEDEQTSQICKWSHAFLKNILFLIQRNDVLCLAAIFSSNSINSINIQFIIFICMKILLYCIYMYYYNLDYMIKLFALINKYIYIYCIYVSLDFFPKVILKFHGQLRALKLVTFMLRWKIFHKESISSIKY